jgi:hypothetical protein
MMRDGVPMCARLSDLPLRDMAVRVNANPTMPLPKFGALVTALLALWHAPVYNKRLVCSGLLPLCTSGCFIPPTPFSVPVWAPPLPLLELDLSPLVKMVELSAAHERSIAPTSSRLQLGGIYYARTRARCTCRFNRRLHPSHQSASTYSSCAALQKCRPLHRDGFGVLSCAARPPQICNDPEARTFPRNSCGMQYTQYFIPVASRSPLTAHLHMLRTVHG